MPRPHNGGNLPPRKPPHPCGGGYLPPYITQSNAGDGSPENQLPEKGRKYAFFR